MDSQAGWLDRHGRQADLQRLRRQTKDRLRQLAEYSALGHDEDGDGLRELSLYPLPFVVLYELEERAAAGAAQLRGCAALLDDTELLRVAGPTALGGVFGALIATSRAMARLGGYEGYVRALSLKVMSDGAASAGHAGV